MDAETSVGAAVKETFARTLLSGLVTLLAVALPAVADEHFALVVTGASGEPEYAEKYDRLRQTLVTTLRDALSYPADHVIVLAERGEPGVREASRENVRAAFGELRQRVARGDVVLVFLVGHGTVFEGEAAKFNLVGPDLSADEWATLVGPIAGRLVFVNTSSASFPFLRALARPGRIVVTATDSAAQQFETVFPEFFIRAFADATSDVDKDGNVSVWEAFSYASAGVRSWFGEQGRLATERALLDDTGAGAGREADAPGRDDALARATYLRPERAAGSPVNPSRVALLQHRAEVNARIERLKAGLPGLLPEEYADELERLLLELASIDRQLREQP